MTTRTLSCATALAVLAASCASAGLQEIQTPRLLGDYTWPPSTDGHYALPSLSRPIPDATGIALHVSGWCVSGAPTCGDPCLWAGIHSVGVDYLTEAHVDIPWGTTGYFDLTSPFAAFDFAQLNWGGIAIEADLSNQPGGIGKSALHLTYAAVVFSTAVPAEGATWGQMKALYGSW